MEIEIRIPNWNDLNERGIPKDSEDIMNYFNKALEKSLFPLVPRRNKITEEEIKNIWVSGKDKDITIIAYSKNLERVVGSGTLFITDKDHTNYGITIDPEFFSKGIGTEITKKIIKEAIKRNVNFMVHTSTENRAMIKIMENLGYKPNRIIKNFDKYVGKVKAKSFDVYEYIIKIK